MKTHFYLLSVLVRLTQKACLVQSQKAREPQVKMIRHKTLSKPPQPGKLLVFYPEMVTSDIELQLKTVLPRPKEAKEVFLQRECLRPSDLNRSFNLPKNNHNSTALLLK